MYALVLLTVSGTDTKHLSVVETDGDVKRINKGRLARKGEIPNALFRKALNESESHHVDVQYIGCSDYDKVEDGPFGFEDKQDAINIGLSIINVKTAVTRTGDLREYTNIGDWLDVPGYIGWEDGSKQYTTSLIRAVMRMNAYTASMTLNVLDVNAWPDDCDKTIEKTDDPIPWKDEREDSWACIMIKHTEDPGFVVMVTRNLHGVNDNPQRYYQAVHKKLPRFARMYDRYQGHDLYYQVITSGSEDRCRGKAREMLAKYVDDIRCLNFESGNW